LYIRRSECRITAFFGDYYLTTILENKLFNASHTYINMLRQILAVLVLTAMGAFGFQYDAKAQDPQFTQFYANPLYLNPAFAGASKCPRVILNYRNQWPALSGTFVSTTASYDQYVPALGGGLGLQVLDDRAGEGTIKLFSASGFYSYQTAISRSFSLRAGAQVTYFQRSLDWSKLTFGDMIDERKGFIYPTNDTPRGGSVNNVDFSAGLLGYSEVLYLGLAVHHITEPNESLIVGETAAPRKITAHIGGKIKLSDSRYSKKSTSFISPNILYMAQADFRQLMVGLYMTKGPLVFGVWYRDKDAFVALLGITAGVVRIGYSYDVTVSTLTTATAGSHEVSAAFQFDCRPPKRRFRTISCPSF
jgi:type IX secretion system PorP/SprF family membrane protein